MARSPLPLRIALRILLPVATSWGLGCWSAAPPPNILLVSIDTLRADHTSAYGYAHDTTPQLEKLAEGGAVFEAAYAPTSTTAPSHATLFTSLHPISHGVVKNGLRLDGQFETLAEILRLHGWETAGFVSSMVLTEIGLDQGFDTYDAAFDAGTSKTSQSDGAQHMFGERADEVNDRRGGATTDRAIAWLRSQAGREEPFLLFVHYFDPHSPYMPPEPFRSRLARHASGPPRPPEVQAYDGEIAYTDHHLGRLVRAVDEIDPDALIVVTADHGEGLGSHGIRYHGARIYEPFVRIPLVIRWRGQIEPGQRFEEPVGLMDVAPTLLDLAEVDPDGLALRGHSLAAALQDGASLDPDRPMRLLRRHYRPQVVDGVRVSGLGYALRVGPLKYIEARRERRRELYNLEADPGESFDLAPFSGEVLQRMESRLERWREENQRAGLAERVSEADRLRLRAMGYLE